MIIRKWEVVRIDDPDGSFGRWRFFRREAAKKFAKKMMEISIIRYHVRKRETS